MRRVDHPTQRCTYCGLAMTYVLSLPAGGAYEIGDAIKTEPIVHYYECPSCDGSHMLTDAGDLFPFGPPPGVPPESIEPEARK